MMSVNDETQIKLEHTEQDSEETCCNIYDSLFEIEKQELCDNSCSNVQPCSDMQSLSEREPVSGSSLKHRPRPCVSSVGATLTTSTFLTEREATEQAKRSDNGISESDTGSKHLCQTIGQHELPASETPNVEHPTLTTVDKRCSNKTKLVTCKICGYQCKYNSGMKRHTKIHTNKCFTCVLCQYKCNFSSDLSRHMRSHSSEKVFACELCQYRSDVKSKLTIHMRTHTGDKPFACSSCPYRSTQKSRLDVHTRTHTGEKPYACEFCQYRGNEKSSLVLHLRTHTGNKPFSCDICKYKCVVKSQLQVHMRTHSGDKPYSCKFCSYKCAQSGNLIKHERKAHSE